AQSLGHGDAGLRYSLLLAADAAGALTAGILLESRGLLPPKARTACVLSLIWCLALGSFALSEHYPLALGLLFVAGFVELAFNAMAQTLVQLEAPPALRGAAIGVYGTFAFGMRTFSGLSIGLVGAQIGIHGALAASAAVFFVLAGFLLRRFLIPDAPGR
ncbi:MAG: MFS transporter, partial [Oceanococcaceae bacterium]